MARQKTGIELGVSVGFTGRSIDRDWLPSVLNHMNKMSATSDDAQKALKKATNNVIRKLHKIAVDQLVAKTALNRPALNRRVSKRLAKGTRTDGLISLTNRAMKATKGGRISYSAGNARVGKITLREVFRAYFKTRTYHDGPYRRIDSSAYNETRRRNRNGGQARRLLNTAKINLSGYTGQAFTTLMNEVGPHMFHEFRHELNKILAAKASA